MEAASGDPVGENCAGYEMSKRVLMGTMKRKSCTYEFIGVLLFSVGVFD